jgi:hypothetical protein
MVAPGPGGGSEKPFALIDAGNAIAASGEGVDTFFQGEFYGCLDHFEDYAAVIGLPRFDLRRVHSIASSTPPTGPIPTWL